MSSSTTADYKPSKESFWVDFALVPGLFNFSCWGWLNVKTLLDASLIISLLFTLKRSGEARGKCFFGWKGILRRWRLRQPSSILAWIKLQVRMDLLWLFSSVFGMLWRMMRRIFVRELHSRGKISKNLGASFIPRSQEPSLMNSKPVSLISSIYKTMAKVLAGRLQKVLSSIISSSLWALQGIILLWSSHRPSPMTQI